MTTYGPYTFDAEDDADCQAFLWNSSQVQTVANTLDPPGTPAKFCHDTNGGNSTNTGPDQGQGGVGDGYAYTECSNPGGNGDTYTVEFNTTLDASAEQWQFNFYTLQRGNDSIGENQTTCEVQINEDSGGWVTVEDVGGVGEDQVGGTVWQSRSVDLSESGANIDSSTRVRLLITTQTTTQVYYGDYGVDTFTFVGTPSADIEQEGYRFYDDGTESGSVARQLQDTVDTIQRETTFQLRTLLNAVGDPDSIQYQLEYKEASDGAGEWRKVPLS